MKNTNKNHLIHRSFLPQDRSSHRITAGNKWGALQTRAASQKSVCCIEMMWCMMESAPAITAEVPGSSSLILNCTKVTGTPAEISGEIYTRRCVCIFSISRSQAPKIAKKPSGALSSSLFSPLLLSNQDHMCFNWQNRGQGNLCEP